MKKIGILGGISSISTIAYYNNILYLYYDKYKNYYYPEINIESLNFQYFTDLEDCNDMENYKKYILKGVRSLEMAGSDIIIMAANSPHSVFPYIQEKTNVPMISIVECVRNFALNNQMRTLLLTGIKYTMKSRFYQKDLSKYGIEVIVPSDEEMDIINHIIFDELAINIISSASQIKFMNIVKKYFSQSNIDGVILGCTELPKFVAELKSPVPLINSVELHCKNILEYCLDR